MLIFHRIPVFFSVIKILSIIIFLIYFLHMYANTFIMFSLTIAICIIFFNFCSYMENLHCCFLIESVKLITMTMHRLTYIHVIHAHVCLACPLHTFVLLVIVTQFITFAVGRIFTVWLKTNQAEEEDCSDQCNYFWQERLSPKLHIS